MAGELKRDMSTKKSRDFWAGVQRACDEFHKLPQWQQDALNRGYKELQDSYKNHVPTCAHCGAETKGRCRSCYGG